MKKTLAWIFFYFTATSVAGFCAVSNLIRGGLFTLPVFFFSICYVLNTHSMCMCVERYFREKPRIIEDIDDEND